jgi:DNA-damage-inducible protein D
MEQDYSSFYRGLEEKTRVSEKGMEFWMARDLAELLVYTDWRNFRSVIEKAKVACRESKRIPEHHFVETTEMVKIGSGAVREVENLFLSRYACYLIAMSADSSKPEVSHALTYFAGQTRRQELRDQQGETAKRLEVRLRLMENNHRLAGAAQDAGVKFYPAFQDAGVQGLYTMSLRELKKKRGLRPTDEMLDRAGRLELSALDFKATMTEQRLKSKQVKTEWEANKTHRQVGHEVRDVMERENGVKPEELPLEPSITTLVRKERKKIKDAKKGRPNPVGGL